MPDKAAISATNVGLSVPGWAAGQTLYFIYDPALTNAQVDAIYNALSLEQKIAQSKTLTQLNQMGFALGQVRGVVVGPIPTYKSDGNIGGYTATA